MKSVKLLVLLSAIALVSCNPTSSSLVISSNSDSSETGSLSCSCYEYGSSSISSKETDSMISSQTISSSLDLSSNAPTTSNPPEPVGISHKVVNFYNGGFTNSSLNQPASQQQFVDWFNSEGDILE